MAGYDIGTSSRFTARHRYAKHAPMKVLIAGGTGMLGAPVVRYLVATGTRVRVMTRRPATARALFGDAVEITVADVTDQSTLAAAVRGCTALHVSLRGANDWRDYDAVERRGLRHLLGAAQAAGLRKVTYLSGAGAIVGNESLAPVRIKLDAEAAIRASGMSYVIFRATHFMESLALFVRGGRATLLGAQPHHYHYLAAEDFARLVGRSLACEVADRKVLYAFGPERFTMHEALTRYLRILRPEVRLTQLPLPLARLIATLTRNADLRFATELFAGFAAIGEAGDPRESDRLLGKPNTTLAAWLAARKLETA
jgi:uncharacterized protein YbjT (DUF2867 family)